MNSNSGSGNLSRFFSNFYFSIGNILTVQQKIFNTMAICFVLQKLSRLFIQQIFIENQLYDMYCICINITEIQLSRQCLPFSSSQRVKQMLSWWGYEYIFKNNMLNTFDRHIYLYKAHYLQ